MAPRRSLDRLITIAERFSQVPPEQVRAGAYGRVSSDPTQGATSVTGQREVHLQMADRMRWPLPESRIWIDNDTSASRFGAAKGVERPEWEKFRQAVRDGGLDVVMLTRTDRGSRTASFRDFVDECRDARVMLCIAGSLYDPGNVDHRMTLGISNQVAEAQAERIHQDALRGKTIAANSGRPAGRPEWGFVRVFNGSGALVAVEHHPHQAKVGAEIIRRVAEFESLRDICADLNARGEPTPSGKPGAKWRNTTIIQVVKSPRWIGKRVIGVREPGSGSRAYSGPVTDLEMVDAMWDRVVSDELWYQANERLSQSSTRARVRNTAQKLATGIVKCHVCEAPVVGDKGGTRYKCSGWPGGDSRGGSHVSISREIADEILSALVVAKLSDPRLRGWYESTEEERAATAQVRMELAEARRRLKDIPRQLEEDEIDLDMAPVMRRKLKARIAELEPKAIPSGMHPLVDRMATPDPAVVQSAWEGLTVVEQREVLLALTQSIELKPVGRAWRHSVDDPERSFEIRWVDSAST